MAADLPAFLTPSPNRSLHLTWGAMLTEAVQRRMLLGVRERAETTAVEAPPG